MSRVYVDVQVCGVLELHMPVNYNWQKTSPNKESESNQQTSSNPALQGDKTVILNREWHNVRLSAKCGEKSALADTIQKSSATLAGKEIWIG